jgi:hypothetical protein
MDIFVGMSSPFAATGLSNLVRDVMTQILLMVTAVLPRANLNSFHAIASK